MNEHGATDGQHVYLVFFVFSANENDGPPSVFAPSTYVPVCVTEQWYNKITLLLVVVSEDNDTTVQ